MDGPTGPFANEILNRVHRWLTRYQPFIITIAAITLIAVFLPGRDSRTGDEVSDITSDFGAIDDGGSFDAGEGKDGDADFGTGDTGGRGGARSRVGAATRRQVPTGPRALTFEEAKARGVDADFGPNCDIERGFVKIPTWLAPPCTPKSDGNPGNTYRGVTDKEVKIGVYLLRDNPAADAILAAAGADDSDEEVRRQYEEWIQLYATYFNTYGREMKVEFFKSSNRAEDDAGGKADAKAMLDKGYFMILNSPNNAFVDEVVAAKTLCMCTVSLPIDFYLNRAPYVWSTLMASHQGYIHRAEYYGKRMAHQKAEHAGDPLIQQQDRVLGLLYYDDEQRAYRSGVDFFKQELQKYRVNLDEKRVFRFRGYPDIAASQEAARPAIQKMIEEGVTTIACACDPFSPIFFTAEATRQRYRPEWYITGSALTDTTFFARTYEPSQWRNAFGISFLVARMKEELSDNFRVYHWHYNKEPTARAGYGVIHAPVAIAMRGIHMAGANLNPQSFRDGLFAMGVLAREKITLPTYSFGRQGFWPWEDYLALDDTTEIWWDPNARGDDEIGNDGQGMYRYVDGGKRYLPGEHPSAPTKAFIPEGSVTFYEDYPPGDAPPGPYEPKRG